MASSSREGDLPPSQPSLPASSSSDDLGLDQPSLPAFLTWSEDEEPVYTRSQVPHIHEWYELIKNIVEEIDEVLTIFPVWMDDVRTEPEMQECIQDLAQAMWIWKKEMVEDYDDNPEAMWYPRAVREDLLELFEFGWRRLRRHYFEIKERVDEIKVERDDYGGPSAKRARKSHEHM